MEQELKGKYIQELMERPHKDGPLKDAHRVFGGGLLGFTEKGWELVDELFGLRYMGAAEYEMGRLPACLGRMVDAHKSLKAGVLEAVSYKKPRSIYYICFSDMEKPVQDLIRRLLKGSVVPKCGNSLHKYFDPEYEYTKQFKGGVSLEEDFFYFVDQPMYERVCAAFELTPVLPKKQPNKKMKPRKNA